MHSLFASDISARFSGDTDFCPFAVLIGGTE
jgi:hypothetical protein